MDRSLFKHAGYHGLSSLVSSAGSRHCCSQLPSPLSLVRTLVVWNTAALSPSERQTRACHTPTHHLMYYTHCRLHHNDILISVCLMARMKFSPPLGRGTQHIINHLYSALNQGHGRRSELKESSAWRRDTPSVLIGGNTSSHIQFRSLTFWHGYSRSFVSLLPSAFLTGHLQLCWKRIETGMVLKDIVKSEGSNYDTISFKMVVPTPCSLTIRNMCSLRNSCVILSTCRKSCPTTFQKKFSHCLNMNGHIHTYIFAVLCVRILNILIQNWTNMAPSHTYPNQLTP